MRALQLAARAHVGLHRRPQALGHEAEHLGVPFGVGDQAAVRLLLGLAEGGEVGGRRGRVADGGLGPGDGGGQRGLRGERGRRGRSQGRVVVVVTRHGGGRRRRRLGHRLGVGAGDQGETGQDGGGESTHRPETLSPVRWKPVTRKYLIRTFGCQMNVHDSERLAGLLEADGMVATDDVEDADLVLLNTCCIRENADNKLYGTLGHLKSVKERTRHADRRRRLPGPEGPGAHPGPGAPGRRRLRHPQRRPGRRAAAGGRRRPAAPSWRSSTRPTRSPRRCPCGATCRTRRGSPSRSAATTPAPSASCRRCGARRSAGRSTRWSTRCAAWPRRARWRSPCSGQNVNSYGRDLTHRRPLFADLLRAVGDVDGIRRVRFTSPHPKDLRPETIAAMAESPAGLRAPPPAPAVGQRPPPGRHAPGLHRVPVPGEAGRGPGRHRRPGRDHRLHRGLPRRDRRRLRAHA